LRVIRRKSMDWQIEMKRSESKCRKQGTVMSVIVVEWVHGRWQAFFACTVILSWMHLAPVENEKTKKMTHQFIFEF
jgi:hypothetical protein